MTGPTDEATTALLVEALEVLARSANPAAWLDETAAAAADVFARIADQAPDVLCGSDALLWFGAAAETEAAARWPQATDVDGVDALGVAA